VLTSLTVQVNPKVYLISGLANVGILRNFVVHFKIELNLKGFESQLPFLNISSQSKFNCSNRQK